jgi:hypothetical protein
MPHFLPQPGRDRGVWSWRSVGWLGLAVALFAIAGCGRAAQGGQSGSTTPPMPPGVVVAVGVDSGYLHTGEIHGRGGAWFAVAVPSSTESSIVRIYRWRGRAWRLDGAVGVPQTPSVQGCAWDLAKPLAISSVACEDGWALATASSGGRPVLALYESWDGRWLRAAVGSAAQLDHNEIFALPQFVLRRLAADVGESLPPPPVPEREPREPSQGEETPPRYMAA